MIATQTAPDCAAFPGFPSCGASLPLSGKLAMLDAASQTITVLDFNAKLTWKINAPPETQRLEWLDGNFLVTYDNQDSPTLAWANPAKPGSFHLPQLSPAGTPGLQRSRRQHGLDGSEGHPILLPRAPRKSCRGTGLAGRPAQRSDPPDPGLGAGRPLLLAGYHFSSNSMWVTGDRLYTLDPASGTIKEMTANLRLGGPFQWHPTQTGLMVFGDSNQSPMMGAPRLAVLDVITGKVTHLIADETVISSYPSWTADGKAILHAASKVGSPIAAERSLRPAGGVSHPWPDGATRRLTTPPAGSRDDWPQLLPDGNHFLYLRVPAGGEPVELRLGSLDGSLDDLVGGGLSPAPTRAVSPALGGDDRLRAVRSFLTFLLQWINRKEVIQTENQKMCGEQISRCVRRAGPSGGGRGGLSQTLMNYL